MWMWNSSTIACSARKERKCVDTAFTAPVFERTDQCRPHITLNTHSQDAKSWKGINSKMCWQAMYIFIFELIPS